MQWTTQLNDLHVQTLQLDKRYACVQHVLRIMSWIHILLTHNNLRTMKEKVWVSLETGVCEQSQIV
jgi:hypothetical protein